MAEWGQSEDWEWVGHLPQHDAALIHYALLRLVLDGHGSEEDQGRARTISAEIWKQRTEVPNA